MNRRCPLIVGEAIHVFVAARLSEDRRVLGPAQPTEFPGQSALDHKGPAWGLASRNQLVELIYMVATQAYRNLDGHNNRMTAERRI